MKGEYMPMIDFLRHCLLTEDGKLVYLLTLISVTMIVDFLTGSWAAKIKKDFKSEKGINGILRKLGSMLLMILFVPFSIVIPNGVGISLVYVLYLGYEVMELESIVENLNKMGVKVAIFKSFIDSTKNEDKE